MKKSPVSYIYTKSPAMMAPRSDIPNPQDQPTHSLFMGAKELWATRYTSAFPCYSRAM